MLRMGRLCLGRAIPIRTLSYYCMFALIMQLSYLVLIVLICQLLRPVLTCRGCLLWMMESAELFSLSLGWRS